MDIQENMFVNRTYNSITNKAVDLGLKKDEKYLYDTRCRTMRKNAEKLYRYVKHGDETIKIYRFKGKDHVRYKERKHINCAYCNKEMDRLESDILPNNNTFCSRECLAKWKSKNMSGINSPLYGFVSSYWTNETRLKQAGIMVKRLLDSDFSYRKTKPQLIADNLLNELNIVNENEFSCKYYLIDNYLNDYNLMIEVQGNFFHCNPVMNYKNSREVKIKGKDKAKHTYVKKYYNIEILYLWEKDIEENLEVCKQLILEYISNNGILEDYHSYNYCLDENNKIKIIDDKYVIGY